MAFKKRVKSTRHRGSHTHGRGGKKKARGSGHRGGFGMAGTGKRGDAKKTMVLNLYGGDYFGKSKTLRRGTPITKIPVMNLEHIGSHLDFLVKSGIAKQSKDGYEITVPKYKILGALENKVKLTIKARAASTGALESVKAAGGQIIFTEANETKGAKAEVKEEKKSAVKAK